MPVSRFIVPAFLGLLVFAAAASVVAARHRAPTPLVASVAPPAARSLALAPHHGSEPLDAQIVAAQQRAAAAPAKDSRPLEKLGWLFVQKARVSNDPGFYKLAEQCARAIEAALPDQPDALLLRGHTAEAMHHFRDAEAIARRLVAQREFFLDHALLGDALMEQGRLDEAIDCYQQMADLKPCLQTYTRVAHVRWLKGDLEGALEVAEEAVGTGTARDPEPLAWALTKLAFYRLQNGEPARAEQTVNEALERLPHYAAALLQRGRVRLAQDRPADALADLREAARFNPLPEYQWALAEALRAADQAGEAAAVETQLAARGAAQDPRTFALYLATGRLRPEEALRLARQELSERQDVFTYDALAWAAFAAGHAEEARTYSQQALAEGTRDPRLLLHAAVISHGLGLPEAAAQLAAAQATRQTLLPSERAALDGARSSALTQH